MGTKFITFSTLAAALVVSGCSSTSPGNPPPEPSPLNYSALRITPNAPGTQTGTGTISGDPQDAVVQVGNATYRFGGSGIPDDTVGNIDVYTYPNFNDGAALYVGNYARAALVADNSVNQQAVVVLNGNRTSAGDLPTQTATYEGGWSIGASDGNSESGVFVSGVNFDRRTYIMDLYDGSGNVPLGTGNGHLQGTGFTGNLTTQGAFQSTNHVDGQFYGPNAAEMAGLISGQSGNAATAGALVGSKQ